MGRFVVLFALAGLIVTAPILAQARGGPLHLYGPFSTPAEAADRAGTQVRPTPTEPPNDFLAGCGHGRYRDPATHRCRGPADVR
jgi:hypothetical protein